MKKSIVAGLLAVVLTVGCGYVRYVSHLSVHAQEATQSATLSSQTKPPDFKQREQQLEQLYQSLIEDYGVKARQFTLNRAQWNSLQTLRSLEDAVTSTNAVLLSRDKVLITYLELLLETLESTQGIELTLKQRSKDALTAHIQWLRNHEKSVITSLDRESVNKRSDEFTVQSLQILFDAKQAIMLIRLGQLQTVVDKSNSLYQRIRDRNTNNQGSSLQQVERNRAYTQVEVLRDNLQDQLRAVSATLDPNLAEQGKVQENYDSFITQLEVPYAGASKYLLFLEELARDSW